MKWMTGVALAFSLAATQASRPYTRALDTLLCDRVAVPLAVEEAQPLLSWHESYLPPGSKQTSVRVVVRDWIGGGRTALNPLWMSDEAETESHEMKYEGPALQPGQAYQWTVLNKYSDGSIGTGSAEFRMADAEWVGKWIKAPWSTAHDGLELDGSKPMPVFRLDFELREPPSLVYLKIAGSGEWQATLDGKDVTSGPEPRRRMFNGSIAAPKAELGEHGEGTDSRTIVSYHTFDVHSKMTRFEGGRRRVTPEHHTVNVMLGSGLYSVPASEGGNAKLAASAGPPKVIVELRLTYRDGHSEVIGSDATWKVTEGPVTFSSFNGGEDFDARRAPLDDASGWSAAEVTDGPGGQPRPATASEIVETGVLYAVGKKVLGPNKVVYDMGQKFSGRPRIEAQGIRGAVLKLTPGELLMPDGSVSQPNSGGPVWWSYTLKGPPLIDLDPEVPSGEGIATLTGGVRGEEWEPEFGHYSFRYLQVEWGGAAMPAAKGGLDAARIPLAKVLNVEGRELGRRVDGKVQNLPSNLPVRAE